MENVNLLTTERKREKKRTSFFSMTLLALLVIVLISVIVILLTLFLKLRISNLVSAENDVINKMQTLADKKAKQQATHERLTSIKKVLVNKDVLTDRVSLILQSIPSSVVVTAVQISEDKLKISIASPNLQAVNDAFDNFKKVPEAKISNVRKVVMSNFGRSYTGTAYRSDIEFSFSSKIN